jgi:oligoendopeptidase F
MLTHTHRSLRRLVVGAWTLPLLGAPRAVAQSPFIAIPTERAASYRANFRNFYPSPDAEVADRAQTYALLARLKQFAGKVASSPDNLLETLRLTEQVTSRFNRHIIYRQLMVATNVSDAASRQQSNSLQADLDAGIAFVRPELVAIDDAKLRSFMTRKRELVPWTFVIARARRARTHTLSAPEERVLGRLGAVRADWPAQLYQQAASRAAAATIDVNGTPTRVATLTNHPEAATRQAAWRARNAAYDAQRDLLALALVSQATDRNELAALRGYRNAADQAYDNLFLDRAGVTRLYERILAKGDVYHRYQRLTADRAAGVAGVREIAIWDQGLVDPNTRGTRFAIDEATRLMISAITLLGSEFRSKMAAILDPANGRLDIAGGPGRAPGAFAWGVPGLMTTFVYQSNYQGTYRDLTTLFHEASHALHGQILGENPQLVSADLGPPYFSEGFAMFFELLLNEQMRNSETDPARKTFLLEQFLWRTMLTFNLVRQAAVEQAIYDGVQSGRVTTADQLDSLTMSIGRTVSIWYERHPELENEWSTLAQYVNSPLYAPNFVYASILGLTLFREYTKDPAAFVPKFLTLMKGGFPAPPAELLKRHLGVDLDDPRTTDAAIALLESRVGELQAAYAGR